MSGKLDQSLDEISKQKAVGRRRIGQRRSSARATVTAPAGGIQKPTRAARGAAAKVAPAKSIPTHTDSKVIVSNLPKDVSEQQIKEYFSQSVGAIKRVDLSYGPNSQSRGIASVTFQKSDGASKAFQKLNGLLVDNRPIKIEIVVGAAQAEKVIPPTKTLAERTTQPKAQPKSAATDKQKMANAKAVGRKRRTRNPRPAKKTAEELDSEMADYFVSAANNENNNSGAPAAANGGDAAMEDEIM